MSFNAAKCEVVQISRKKTVLQKIYTTKGQALQEVNKARYLGVIISNDLQSSTHVSTITKKANSSPGFLRRNLKNAPPKLKEIAYFSLVRSVVEYSATVWDPHLCKDKDALEMVQRRAARNVKNDHRQTSSVTRMLKDLGWESLADRRRDLRLVLLHKIVNHFAMVTTDDILIPADLRTRANHPYKFRTIRANTTIFRYSFFVNIIPAWNSLQDETVKSMTAETFKSRLKSEHRQ